jgi:small subunit ribosomal protein S1
MEDLLRASEQQYRTLKHGDVIEGTVMKLGRDEILVDIGAKTEGIIPSHELQSLSPEEREAMEIGDEVLVSVVQPENAEGHAILSLDRARQERSWRELQKKFEAGEIIQARVTGYNKGGLLVNLEGVRGFVPSSQISSMPPGDANKQAEMAKMQNQTLPLKIIEINRNRNRLILSERQAMQEQRESMRTRLLRELEPGQVRPGTVSSICDFGAFVDIGGADGLIHLSELSWKRVSHPSEVLRVGDRIDVYVLSVDPNERKIALSLKRTQPEPWSTITENYSLGQIVRGTITQLTTFGAFARLEDGIEGLIHVSELAEGRVAHPKNVVNVGDQLDLKVIRIDPAKRRIGLSLKRVNEDAEGAGGQGGYGQPIVGEGNQATTQGAFGEEGGAGGDYLETAPRSQSADVEAHSEGVRDFVTQPQGQVQGEPSARPQTQDRGQSRQDRQERQERQERQQAQRQQRQSAGAPRVPMAEQEAEPMGALGQALAARFAQVQAEAEAEEDTTTTAPEAVAEAPEVETPDAPEAVAEAPEVETPEAPEAMPEFTEEAAPEAEAEEAPEVVAEAAPEAAEEEAPEASTYATDETAESVEAASEDTADDATDVSGAEDAVDEAAANEAEEEGTGDASADAGTEEASDASLADVTDEVATDQPSQSGGEGAPSQADADAGEETEAFRQITGCED